MKKLLALFLAIAMVFSFGVLCISAYGTTENVSSFVTVDTAPSTDYYNFGDTIYVEFTIGNVTLEGADGVSGYDFKLRYDSSRVEPITVNGGTVTGERDFAPFLTTNSGGAWEVYGALDRAQSCYILGFCDLMLADVLTADKQHNIKIPFRVLNNAEAGNIVFSFLSAAAYNVDLSLSCDINVEDVVVKQKLQPDNLSSLPASAIPLHIGGYKHDINNVIFCADREMTVSEYVCKFIDPINKQDEMQNFATVIVNKDNKVLSVNLEAGDKSAEIIPEGGYIIGIHLDNTSAVSYLAQNAFKGTAITLYNVNIGATRYFDKGTALISAGFTMSKFELKSGANAYLDKEKKILTVYQPDITLSELNDMFISEISLCDKEGNYLTDSDIVVTGMTLDHVDDYTVIIKGDVNCDGVVDVFDALSLKNHIMRGMYLPKECIAAGCFYSDTPDSFDYLVIKNHTFGLADFSQFKPQA